VFSVLLVLGQSKGIIVASPWGSSNDLIIVAVRSSQVGYFVDLVRSFLAWARVGGLKFIAPP
jgi:hypothetical protein